MRLSNRSEILSRSSRASSISLNDTVLVSIRACNSFFTFFFSTTSDSEVIPSLTSTKYLSAFFFLFCCSGVFFNLFGIENIISAASSICFSFILSDAVPFKAAKTFLPSLVASSSVRPRALASKLAALILSIASLASFSSSAISNGFCLATAFLALSLAF